MKKKVLIMSLGSKYGGAEKYTESLVKNIDRTKFEVFCAVRYKGLLNEHLPDIKKISLDISLKGLLPSILHLKKFVKDNKIEVIHANGINAMFLMVFLPNKLKRISVIHGDTYMDHKGMGVIKEKIFPKLEILLCNYFDICVAVSESLKNVLIRRGAIPEKVRVIYNGIEVYRYPVTKRNSEKIKICSIGNLLPIKNHILMLEALNAFKKIYPQELWQCDIYGVGECENLLKSYIKANNLYNVHLKGFNNCIREKLNDYHICIQTSLYESFGLSIIEALNAGCYIIATDVGGIKEIMQKFPDRGCLVSVNDSCDIMKKLNMLCKDRRLLSYGKENVEKKIEKFFSIEIMTKDLEEIYRR